MRQGQSKRIRGRSRGGGGGGGGGKGPNPLTRSYESNGPDVKIRGTAGTIADKYVQLSRDALSAGDPVSAENYMQHAEHYYRLLAAAQAQYQPHQTFVRADADDFNDQDGDEEGGAEGGEANGQPANAGGQPQPYGGGNQQPRFNGQRQNGGYGQNGREGGYNGNRDGDQQRRFDRNNDRNDRRDRPDNRFDRNDRGERNDNRNDRGQGGYDRGDRPARAERSDEQPTVGELPAFITREAPPVAAEAPPRPAPEPVQEERAPDAPESSEGATTDVAAAGDEDRAPPRGRRRRYGRFGRGSSLSEENGESAGEGSPPAPEASSD